MVCKDTKKVFCSSVFVLIASKLSRFGEDFTCQDFVMPVDSRNRGEDHSMRSGEATSDCISDEIVHSARTAGGMEVEGGNDHKAGIESSVKVGSKNMTKKLILPCDTFDVSHMHSDFHSFHELNDAKVKCKAIACLQQLYLHCCPDHNCILWYC